MRIAVIDSSGHALANAAEAIRAAMPAGSSLVASTGHDDEIDEILRRPPDVAFVAVYHPGLDGVALARALREASPITNIVFCAMNGECMAEALAMHCSGYVNGPLSAGSVREELANLRYPVHAEGAPSSGGGGDAPLQIRCFGNFEVFHDGKPLRFGRGKTKELLAYLVSLRGATASVAEVEAALWEQHSFSPSKQSYLRHLVADLRQTLESIGVGDLLVKRHGTLAIDPSVADCDYFDFLDNKPGAPRFAGQFMEQYSWAEKIKGSLTYSTRQ